MNAIELRIGNYIQTKIGKNKGRVLSIGSLEQEFEQIYCECEESFEWYFTNGYEGIPLTEKWLLKFGLTKTNGGNFSCEDICVYDNLENINISLENGDIGVELRCPKYVHQLQNLYFALTGEELEIKEEAK